MRRKIQISIFLISILILWGSLLAKVGGNDAKVVFLTQDVAEGYDHRGCTPPLLKKLIENFENQHSEKYIYYDVTKLMENDIGPYYIFNKKYCKKIGELLDANIFVMSRLVLVGHDKLGECKGDLFDIHVKVYSNQNDKELTLYKESKVPVYKFDNLPINRDDEYITKILEINGIVETENPNPIDTLYISNKMILFFSLSQKEYDKLSLDEDSGIDEVISDFNYYSTKIIEVLSSQNIESKYISKKKFVLKYDNDDLFVFDRDKTDHIVGAILIDGKTKPKILTGVYTDIDYQVEINDYYK